MDGEEMLVGIKGVDQACRFFCPFNVGGEVEAILAVGMDFVLVGESPHEKIIEGRVAGGDVAEPGAIALFGPGFGIVDGRLIIIEED